MNSLDRKLIRDLLHLRGQIIAVALVVACGVASFVSMRNMYRSLLATQVAYYTEYRFADLFAHLKRAPEWIAPRIAEIAGVAVVQTRIVAAVTLDVPGLNEPATGQLVSIPEKRGLMLNDLHLKRGRYIEPGRRDEVLISEAFASKNNLNPGDTISAVINGRWTKLQIAGVALSPEFVYEIRSGDLFPDNRRFGVIWISRNAVESALDMEGAFNDVTLSLSPDANQAEVISQLDALLKDYGGLGAYGRDTQVSNFFIENEIGELKVTGTFIPAIFLGVTAFMIHLVLSRLVNTQRDQIAVLKAFGYDNRVIGLHYLKMALVAVSAGIIIGTGVGWYFGLSITSLYADFFRFPVLRYEMNWQVIGVAVLISFASASLGAMRAVQRAVSLPPAEAMRPEAPARYHVSLIERIGGRRFLPLTARIIIRNLARNSVKAVLTSFGIALAVSLLIVSFYFYDAIDQIIAIQFNTVNREDANVIFNEPRPARTRYDLLNLPGVMRVEGYRTVPARLSFAHRTRRIALLGMDPNGQLQRIVDRSFNIIAPPPDGLVLTTKLAEILGVRAGDSVTVEVLEGARPVRRMLVAALADEVLGLSAYLDIRALNRLMLEGGTISGARLLVDPQVAPTLYTQLKQTPAVTGVTVPESALANFNETLARTMGTSTSIIILFGCVIAFGMIYNGARIALSERGRELASLRVLGFTKREIGMMLLGEQAILTAIAIPLGYALGFGICFLIVNVADTELIRLPLVLSGRTYALSFVVIVCAASLSGLLVGWRLRRLDLIEVLKTRE
jgi:putative ABC transport system permease protein